MNKKHLFLALICGARIYSDSIPEEMLLNTQVMPPSYEEVLAITDTPTLDTANKQEEWVDTSKGSLLNTRQKLPHVKSIDVNKQIAQLKQQTENICLAAGIPGRYYQQAPQNVKDAVNKLCCGYSSFISTHPRAAAAIECKPGTRIFAEKADAQARDAVCNKAIGRIGRYLTNVDTLAGKPGVANAVADFCCETPGFKETHPRAYAALGCDREY